MKICKKCGNNIPNSVVIKNKRRTLSGRKYCIECSPFGNRNTRKICGEHDKRNLGKTFEIMPSKKQIYETALSRGYKVTEEGDIITRKGNKLKGTVNNKYLKFCISISLNKKKVTVSIPIHRIQAYLKFKDLIFSKGMQVRHLNNNP
jgi:hypothetical protein